MQDMDAYDASTSARLNSLFLLNYSLFFETFSLLIYLGNCSRSACSTAVSCFGIGPGSLKSAKFPVKFPVSREFVWRHALRRQPTIFNLREFPSLHEKTPPNEGFFLQWPFPETGVRTFGAENSRKSPAVTTRIPVFQRLGLETGG